MFAMFKRLAKRVVRVVVRLWIGDPRTPYEKIVFDASRQMARQFGAVA